MRSSVCVYVLIRARGRNGYCACARANLIKSLQLGTRSDLDLASAADIRYPGYGDLFTDPEPGRAVAVVSEL